MGELRTDASARPPLWAPGAALGAVSAAFMAGPSLSAKGPLQKYAVAGAAAMGFAAGTGTEALSRALGDRLPGDHVHAQLAVGGAGVALAAGMALASRGRPTGVRAALQSGGIVLAAGGATGIASSLVSRADDRLPGDDWMAQGGLAALAGTAMLGVALRDVRASRGVAQMLPDLPELAVDAKRVEGLAVNHGRGVRGALTSGGADSLVAMDLLPGQGQRFLTEMPHADEIARVMETATAKEPIRAYVGTRHVPADVPSDVAIQRRAALAVAELDRLGAFGRIETLADGSVRVLEQPRRSILVAAPTASGYVNPVATSTHEFMNLGDTAAVAIEVAKKKTPGELRRAAETHRALLEHVANRIDGLPPQLRRPKLQAYGESFGAWTSQRALSNSTHDAATALRVADDLDLAHAMYVGTPGLSPLRVNMLDDAARAGGADPVVRNVANLPEARTWTRSGEAAPRMTFLQHEIDAVGLAQPKLLWERPEWLGSAASRSEFVPRRQRWAPGLTGLQTAIDQQLAQEFKQGVLEAKGHDYRLEVSYVMRKAFGMDDVTDTQVSRIREWNRQLEHIHGLHQAEARAERAAVAAAAAGR